MPLATDPVGAYQDSRKNMLAMRKAEQDIAREEASIPTRNILAQQQVQAGQQNLDIGRQNLLAGVAQENRAATSYDQATKVKQATAINNAARLLKSVPVEQRPGTFKAIEQSLVDFGVPIGSIDANEAVNDQFLDQTIAATQVALGMPEGVSDLDKAKTEKAISEADFAKARAEKTRNESINGVSDFKREEFEFKKQVEQRMSTKLTAPSEKALIEAQEAATSAQRSSSEFDILAKQVEDADISGGLASTTTETFKKLLGTQDDVTEFRRRFNLVRLSQGLKNLPPGPATDRDVVEAFKGVPAENAPTGQIASFLRGAAKMARFDAAYNQFKSDFISETNSVKGLNQEWRRPVNSEALGRQISIAEIYAEAADSGLTPEQVKAELGVTE